jgi:hypothetical protein
MTWLDASTRQTRKHDLAGRFNAGQARKHDLAGRFNAVRPENMTWLDASTRQTRKHDLAGRFNAGQARKHDLAGRFNAVRPENWNQAQKRESDVICRTQTTSLSSFVSNLESSGLGQ